MSRMWRWGLGWALSLIVLGSVSGAANASPKDQEAAKKQAAAAVCKMQTDLIGGGLDYNAAIEKYRAASSNPANAKLPPDFPRPGDCPPPTAGGQAYGGGIYAQPSQPLSNVPGAVYNTESGFEIGVVGGGDVSCDFQNFYSVVTLGAPDAISTSTRQACASQIVGGATLSVNAFKIAENESPRPEDRAFFNQNYFQNVTVGAQATLLGGTGSTILTGTPTIAIPGAGSDYYKTTDNFIGLLDATATIPVNPTTAVEFRAGWAIDDKTVAYSCNGLCAAAGAPPSVQSETKWLSGPTAGISLLAPITGTAATFSVNFDYVDLQRQSFSFGMPATVNPAFNLSQGIFIVTFGASMPLTGPQPFQTEAISQPNHRF